MKENALIIVLGLFIVITPLSIWWAYSAGYASGTADCQTKSQAAVIKQKERYDVELAKASVKIKQRANAISRYEQELRYMADDSCPSSRVPDLRAKRLRDQIRTLMQQSNAL